MSNLSFEDVKEQILRFLAKHPSEQFKPNVIARRLSIKSQDAQRMFQKALNELYQSHSIDRGKRKRYCHTKPPISHHLIGKLTIKKGNSGIVDLYPPHKGCVSVSSHFLSTALDGDIVAVVLFARSVSDENKLITDKILEGEIIDIIERSKKPIVGVYQKSRNFFFVVPDESKISRDIYIPEEKNKGARPGQKVVAQIDSWESRNLNPEGQIIEVLGKSGEVRAEMLAVAREFQLPLHFPKSVIAESEKIDDSIAKEEYKRRLDLRNLISFTIDPEDAKDFDDAISLEKLPNGNWQLGVHIADVSHYVREGTLLDAEASRRGTSIYLADEVIPMLPEKLSNNICSLRPDEDRLTYSTLMIINPKGIIEDYQILKTVIHSHRRYTYEEVQKIIDTGRGEYREILNKMYALSKTLLNRRMKEGSIDFESVEVKFRFDKAGKPTEIVKKPRLDSHRLVEEFMLLANQTVAKHIGRNQKEGNVQPFMYRIHEPPPPDRLNDFASFVEHLGYSLNVTSGVSTRALQKLLNEIKGKEEENVINEVAIRSMAKAVYSIENVGHFGLGFKYYTHFTSPIRRYPDLIVHRLLNEYALKMPHKRREQLIKTLPDVCEHSSEMERIAMEAERASVKVMQVEYMKRHVGDEFHAIISGVTNFGLFVKITDLLVEGLIRIRDMEDDYYIFDEKRYALVGRRTNKSYRLGDKVDIQVIRVDPGEREIDFSLME